MTSIAILGATGHIGKSLLFNLLGSPGYRVSCYARSKEKLDAFLSEIGGGREVESSDDVEALLRFDYDVIVNCVGVGNPGLLREIGPGILTLTERFDNLVLDYLDKHRETLYINLSSGAVYGTEFADAVDSGSEARIPINAIGPAHYYRTAKIYSEVKHRAHASYRIVDLRVFSYFGRFVDLTSSYLVTDLVNCCRSRLPFVTDATDIVRDFIHPSDLLRAIEACARTGVRNAAFDLYSKAPVTKWDLVRLFESRYGLQVEITATAKGSVTGTKSNYYSKDRRLGNLGYTPVFSSIEGIGLELSKLMP